MYLVSRSSTGKIRVVNINLINNEDNTFTITRYTGQYKGKMTEQPNIEITAGKVKRTVEQQAELEFNSHVKKYKDKGYKELDGDITNYSESELNSIIPDVLTNSSGGIKPMLAKQADQIKNKKVFDKQYLASRKIDGLRVIIYQAEDGTLHTSSRGATNYDPAMTDIIHHPTLIKMFNNNPGLILDGEAYKHGWSLQKLNSIARTQKTAVDYEVLQFYWYDIVDLDLSAEDRIDKMKVLAAEYNINWDPERKFEYGELRIQLVPQVSVSGWDNIKKLHNDYVSEGWEGVVIRLTTAKYTPNGRKNDMIKVKEYCDFEFLIIGYELGLRGSEDMCFKCVTEDGIEFLAKPWGDRDLKQWYVDNFETECLNHMATVKYFYLSDDGTPLQPSIKSIRLNDDMN